MFAKVTIRWFGRPPETHTFANIVESEVSFYDNLFWSRVGYADFNLKFAYDPVKKNSYPNDDVGRFSRWWHNLNKDTIPPIFVELISGSTVVASGNLQDWEENREEFEVGFTIIDESAKFFDEQVSRTAITYTSPEILPKATTLWTRKPT